MRSTACSNSSTRPAALCNVLLCQHVHFHTLQPWCQSAHGSTISGTWSQQSHSHHLTHLRDSLSPQHLIHAPTHSRQHSFNTCLYISPLPTPPPPQTPGSADTPPPPCPQASRLTSCPAPCGLLPACPTYPAHPCWRQQQQHCWPTWHCVHLNKQHRYVPCVCRRVAYVC